MGLGVDLTEYQSIRAKGGRVRAGAIPIWLPPGRSSFINRNNSGATGPFPPAGMEIALGGIVDRAVAVFLDVYGNFSSCVRWGRGASSGGMSDLTRLH